ncbi:MAG: PaaI family thioesterase [Pseudomonadota bacterium]
MFNPGRRIQGGILTAMMDDTMGPLINIMSAGKKLPSSTDLHTQFHRPAAPGVLTCKAQVTRMGAQICTSTAELYGEHGKMIASCIHTAVLMPFSI